MARFLKNSDYSALIRNEIKAILINATEGNKLLVAEMMGVEQVRNFLVGNYDVEAIFPENNEAFDLNEFLTDPPADPTADTRNYYIVMLCLDCTLYHLYSSLAPNRIPEHRSQRYEDALKWLMPVSKGQSVANLPRLKDADGVDQGSFRLGTVPHKNQW